MKHSSLFLKSTTNKAVFALLVFVMGFGFVSESRADNEGDRSRKLGRGLVNIFTSVLEVPKNVYQIKEEHGDVAAVSWGFLRGCCRWGIRTGVGVYETLTFLDGAPTIIEPEFPFAPHAYDTNWRYRRRF